MRFKYPRTPHLPWSRTMSSDDIRLFNTNQFVGKEVVVTEKMDGENTTLYRDGVHARSINSGYHPSRSWVQALQGQVGWQIPQGWRICGENLYARHSISYQQLTSYFLVFSVWNERNECLDWDETCAFAERLALTMVPELYRGPWDESAIRAIDVNTAFQEGYVVRVTNRFAFADFRQNIAKWVRKGHVNTGTHWMHQPLVPNGLGGRDAHD